MRFAYTRLTLSVFCSEFQPIDYPAPDGKISFDILTSVSLTGTNHAENQPVHLKLPSEPGAKAKHTEVNVESKHYIKSRLLCLTTVPEYAGLLGRACPAAVYEYQDAEGDAADAAGKKFVINSQNCIHVSIRQSALVAVTDVSSKCKTCSVKVPTQDITWTVPEGGGGPKYSMCFGLVEFRVLLIHAIFCSHDIVTVMFFECPSDFWLFRIHITTASMSRLFRSLSGPCLLRVIDPNHRALLRLPNLTSHKLSPSVYLPASLTAPSASVGVRLIVVLIAFICLVPGVAIGIESKFRQYCRLSVLGVDAPLEIGVCVAEVLVEDARQG